LAAAGVGPVPGWPRWCPAVGGLSSFSFSLGPFGPALASLVAARLPPWGRLASELAGGVAPSSGSSGGEGFHLGCKGREVVVWWSQRA
jgi:hypothetical protein